MDVIKAETKALIRENEVLILRVAETGKVAMNERLPSPDQIKAMKAHMQAAMMPMGFDQATEIMDQTFRTFWPNHGLPDELMAAMTHDLACVPEWAGVKAVEAASRELKHAPNRAELADYIDAALEHPRKLRRGLDALRRPEREDEPKMTYEEAQENFGNLKKSLGWI